MCDTIHFLKKYNTKQHFCHKEELKYIERKKKKTGVKKSITKDERQFFKFVICLSLKQMNRVLLLFSGKW